MGYSVEEILGWYRPGGLAEVRQGSFTGPPGKQKLTHTVVHEMSHHDLVTNTLFGTVLRFVVEAKLKQQATVIATAGDEVAQIETGGLLDKLRNDAWSCLEGLACFEEYCTLLGYHISDSDSHGPVTWRRFKRRLPKDYQQALEFFSPLRLSSLEKKFSTSDSEQFRQLALTLVLFQQVAARAIAEMALDLPFLLSETPSQIEAMVGRLIISGDRKNSCGSVIEQLSLYLAENMQQCYEKNGLTPLAQLAELEPLKHHNTFLRVSEAIKSDIVSGTVLKDTIVSPSLLLYPSLTETKAQLLRDMQRYEFFGKIDIHNRGDRDRLLVEEVNRFYAQASGDESIAGAPIRYNASLLQAIIVEPDNVSVDELREWLARMESPEGGGSGRFVGESLWNNGEIVVLLAFQQIIRTEVSGQLHLKPHLLDDRVECLGDLETLTQVLADLGVIWVHGVFDVIYFQPDQYWSLLPLALPGRHYFYSQVFSSGHLIFAKNHLLELSGDASVNAEQCEFSQGENQVTVLGLSAPSNPAHNYLFIYPGPAQDLVQFQGHLFSDVQDDTNDIITAGLVAQKVIMP